MNIKLAALFCLLFTTSFSLLAQTHVNKYFLSPFGTPSEDLEWSASATDISGNKYVIGNTITSPTKVEILVTKINSTDSIEWQTTFSPAGYSLTKNYGIAAAVDSSGNVYVAGTSYAAPTENFNYIILKFDTSGNVIWTTTYNGPSNGEDYPSSIILDNNNNLYVSGASKGITTKFDYLTLKINAINGSIVWENRTDKSNEDNVVVDLKISNSNKPVLLGLNSTGTGYNVSLQRLNDTDGSLNAENNSPSSFSSSDRPTSLIKDVNDNYYIIGSVLEGTTNRNFAIIKLDEDLNLLWEQSYDGGGNDETATSIKIDNNGDVLVSGTIQSSSGQKSILVQKYTANGNLLWNSIRYPGNEDKSVIAVRSTIGNNGDLYVMGREEEGNSSRILTFKLASDGNRVWDDTYSYTGIIPPENRTMT